MFANINYTVVQYSFLHADKDVTAFGTFTVQLCPYDLIDILCYLHDLLISLIISSISLDIILVVLGHDCGGSSFSDPEFALHAGATTDVVQK